MRYRARGMSRIETTVYSGNVYDVEDYQLIIQQTVERMSECPTFEISFDRQWRALANEIRSFFRDIRPRSTYVCILSLVEFDHGKETGRVPI